MASINRRGFLSFLSSAAAVAATLDPERLLWTPGAKLISIPKPRIATVEETVAMMFREVMPLLNAEIFDSPGMWARVEDIGDVNFYKSIKGLEIHQTTFS